MNEHDHPDHISQGDARRNVQADIHAHPHDLDEHGADPGHDVPGPDHDKGQPDWAKAGKSHPDHWTQVGDTWVHDTDG